MVKLLTLAAGLASAVLTLSLAGAALAEGPVHDGSHDFDFNFGTWHTHITRILDPFSGGSHKVVLDGTVTVRKVWGGRAWLEEIEADGAGDHLKGATLFLYNPQSGQWSQTFADSQSGALDTPTIGAFHDGAGELYATDTFDGRQVLRRGTWSVITPDAHTYVEALSNDGGKTWVAVFTGNLTRLK